MLRKTNANKTTGRQAEIQSGDFTNDNPRHILKANGRKNEWKEGTNKINKTLRRRNNNIQDRYKVKENENVERKIKIRKVGKKKIKDKYYEKERKYKSKM